MKARLAVVIVSYNTVVLLRQCLSSLRASLTRSWGWADIIVVDNGSADGTVSMVATEFPEVHLRAQSDNRGFAAANNVAIEEFDADFFLFLNPDTDVLGEAPAALVRFLENHLDVGLCGGRLLNPDLSFQESAYTFPSLPMSFIDFFPINYRLTRSRLNGRYPRASYGRTFEIDHPLGACMCVRADVIQRVGGFDEGFFMYCEEVDWCIRIKQNGWRIAYTPDAEIIHHLGASSRQNAGPMLVQLHRSRDRLFQKHYGPAYTVVARQIVRIGMRQATARARAEFRAGRIDENELNRRCGTYREVTMWEPLA